MKRQLLFAALVATLCSAQLHAQLGGDIPGPLPLFPPTNWWNLDISQAPVDPASSNFIDFIGLTRRVHPDFGGEESPGSESIYGFPYVVVDGDFTPVTVQFLYADESDGVDHEDNDTSFPFYPIPPEAESEPHYVEAGPPADVDLRDDSDRHLLMIDRDNRHLYELYNVFFDGEEWHAGSGAFFDLDANDRRPDGWTSADAAGLAIFPGLVRYDEVFGSGEIEHAFRMTVRTTNGYVFPASHRAGSTSGALPMGARLRLKESVDISGYTAEIQRVFRAMKKYGLIVADNGTDMYVSGTFDTRWDNDILNPAFHSLHASDFEVVELGWNPPPVTITSVTPRHGPAAGGTPLTILGTNFDPAAEVTIGGTDAVGVVATSSQITATTPPHAPGTVPVVVDNPEDPAAGSFFTFTDPAPAASDVNGDGVVNLADVFYLANYLLASGPYPVGDGDVNDDTSITAADAFALIEDVL